MKFLGWELRKTVAQGLSEEKQNQFEDVLRRLMAVRDGIGEITPENCEQSPTVKAIVTAIARRFAVTPVHVYEKTTKDGRDAKEKLASHPVARLLSKPNDFQTRVDYWQDAVSRFARYGCFYAYKSRGSTGPIRALLPMHPSTVDVRQDPETWAVTYQYGQGPQTFEYPQSKVHHVRAVSRNGFSGDSPVRDVRQAIALEIAAERFGASFFENGAIPMLVFQYIQGVQAFKELEQEKQFIDSVQAAFSGNRRFRSMLLPKGLELGTPISIDNDKTQLLPLREYQRTVIAGAWGVPPHLVGDLKRATFNNVEQQDGDFTLNVIMPIAQAFEAAMERDLLTDDDRASGIVIRFNLDSILRADFKSRQEGLRIQRDAGVISPNEWREIEGRNPISEEDGGDNYTYPANMVVAGKEPPPAPPPSKEVTPKPSADEAADKFMSTLRDGLKALEPAAPPQVSVSLTNNLSPRTDVSVDVKPASLTVEGAQVDVKTAPPQIEVPVNVNVQPATVDVKASDVTVNSAATPVNIENKIQPTPIEVEVKPIVNVEPTPVHITNDVKTPEVFIEPPTVNVQAPVVNVDAPIVNVNNDVPVPSVTVEQAKVQVDNHIESPKVEVTNQVEAPIVNVESPTVDVKAPQVTVHNNLPEYETVEQEVKRDSKGRISKTVTTRKKKS